MFNKFTSILIFVMGLTFSVLLVAKEMPGTAEMPSAGTKYVMSHEMMRNMTRLMHQMQMMTRDMNRIMEKSATMDKARIREMAKVMEKLALAMRKMSQHMLEGDMNKNMFQEMERQMNQIQTMIKAMEQKEK